MCEGRAAVQRDLSRSEKWAGGNLIKFNMGGYNIMPPGGDRLVR